MIILTQAMGVVAASLSIYSFQRNSQKGVLIFQLTASFFWVIHFSMLGSPTGAVLNGVGIIRAIVFYFRDQAWVRHPATLVCILALAIGAGILSWTGPISVLPIVGMIFTTIAFRLRNPLWIRRVSLPSSPCWLIYNLINHSYPGVITESFVICSIIIAMFRYDRHHLSATD